LITVDPEQSEQAGTPRALYPKPFKPGQSLGYPNKPELQRQILRDALGLMHYPQEPGSIVTREYGQG
jgi:hypothetical protein